MMTYIIGDRVSHKLFGAGLVVRLNMSGPMIKFDNWEHEMCCPNYSLKKIVK